MSSLEEAASRLGTRAERDVPLGPLTTYRVGGAAALLVTVVGEEDLVALVDAVSSTGVPVLVAGKGSNLLVADAGFPGVAVRLGENYGAVEIGEGVVEAGGAVAYPVLARKTGAAGLSGLEWAVGIPGSVGGAVRMNAGGHGAETREVLDSATVLDLSRPGGGPVRRPTSALGFSYRRSAISSSDLVLSASYRLGQGEPAVSAARISEIVRWRRENQPGGQNAGSVFTNPPGDSAGRLIDEAGLKGFRIGTAAVSDKHANFIQADAGGSADDVRRVIEEVRRLVCQRTGVELDVELRFVGFSSSGC